MEPKQKLEEYLEGVHKDRERFREMVLPADNPPISELSSQCDDSPPRWKGARHNMQRPLQPGCFKILMETNKSIAKAWRIRKAWCRAGEIFML